MARTVFVAVFLSCVALISPSVEGGFRVDVLGWDPFGQIATGWELGLEVYATREEAERYQEAAERWSIVKSIRIVEIDEPPVEVQLPESFNLTVPDLDENGDPIAGENGTAPTRAEFTELIDQIYGNARQAQQWAFARPDELSPEAFNKVNALIEKYNFAVAKANRCRRAPYATMKLLTPVDVFAARTRKLLYDHQQSHVATMRDLSETLAALNTDRETLLATQRQLDARRSDLVRQESESLASYEKKLAEITKGFAEVDAVLATNPSDEELKAQGIEERLESLRGQRAKLESENDDAKARLKTKYETWKKDYELLGTKFKDFNKQSREVKIRLSDHKEKVENSTKAFVLMRDTVHAYFGDQPLDPAKTSQSQAIQVLLQGDP